MGGDARDAVEQVGGRDVVFTVIHAEVPRGDAGVLHLVVAGGVEADRVGARGLAEHLAQHAAHRGAVGAAGEEAAGGMPGGLAGHVLLDDVEEALFALGEVGCVAFVESGLPPGHALCAAGSGPLQHMAGRQALDIREDGARRRDHVEIQVVEDRLRRQRARVARHAIGAVGEAQPAIRLAVADRPGAEAVVRQPGLAGFGLDDDDREAPVCHRRSAMAAAAEGLHPCRRNAAVAGDAGELRVLKARLADREA